MRDAAAKITLDLSWLHRPASGSCRIAQLLKSSPDPLVSQFRATYTTLLNLLDAYGSFSQVREIAEKSFAHREAAHHIARLEANREESLQRIATKLREANCHLPVSAALGFERLVSSRGRLQETTPQTRAELLLHWLHEVVQPGRVIGIGRSGKRLVMVTDRRAGNVLGTREDGRRATLALERIGPVYAPFYQSEKSPPSGPLLKFTRRVANWCCPNRACAMCMRNSRKPWSYLTKR